MVLPLEKRHLEGQDGKQAVHIAPDALDAILLPSPNLWRNVIVHGTNALRPDETGHLEVETGIIYQNDGIRPPLGYGTLARCQPTQNGPGVEQHGDKAHIGQLAVMTQQHAAGCLHLVAAVAAKLGFGVPLKQGTHQVGRMQIATGLAGH